jgi:V8-like Glu-specific endopeptidase
MKKFAWALLVLVAMMVLGMQQAVAQDVAVSAWVAQPTAASGASDYWTKARMLNAKPYPLPSRQGSPQPIPGGLQESPGEPGAIKGRPPENTSVLLSEDLMDSLVLSGAVEPDDRGEPGNPPLEIGYDYPPPQTTHRVFDVLYGNTSSVFPYKAVGKVFFKGADGKNYVCSGSSIGNRAVLTAGHCVADGKGHWHTEWVFCPAYKNGVSPYGVWKQSWVTTSPAWFKEGKFERDIGFSVVYDQGGKKLSQKVGYLGFAWDYPRVQHWNMLGYPSVSPFDGKYMYATEASYSNEDGENLPPTTGIGTDQTPGCSGGPWILKFGPNGTQGVENMVNGVNSYFYNSEPKRMYSPYFDTWVKKNLYTPALAK